ncbi:MAG: phosphotransferase [Saccharospirillaceae bacterium]|nr:phosphotransferase [Saccharospirillaceae bacterium]MCD8530263.1 phosphotransferase [Saccharospirillaceae bacterium]
MLQPILNDWPQWKLCSEAPAPDNISPLPGGLTNHCYRLRLPEGEYVLRVEGRNSRALDINRAAELKVHHLVADHGLTPAIRFRSETRHYWIRDYVPGMPLTQQQLHLPLLLTMAQQLQQLHQLPSPPGVPALSISEKAGRYWDTITAQCAVMDASSVAAEELLALRGPLQSLLSGAPDNQRCLCHMDPTAPNWIQTADSKLVLLDWEYAAIGHPLWDLAALLQGVDLSADDEQTLLQAYGLKHYRGWEFAKTQMSYLAALWYRAQGLWSDRELIAYLNGLKALAE